MTLTQLTHLSKRLAYMRANGFTHRDLKPANILIQLKRGRLIATKIADFGTTKYELSGRMRTYAGSSVYMASEFWKQELAYINAVNMFSFGVIAVKVLSRWADGRDPRFPPSRAQHQKWIGETLHPRVALTPERYRPLLLGLLSEIPEHRWTAIDCEIWLQKNAEADTSSSRKRGAPPLSEDTCGSEHRRGRSNHPNLSTIRDGNKFLSGSTIPNTEPWRSSPPNPDDVKPLDNEKNQDV
jgi:serine/threonine protein kinase